MGFVKDKMTKWSGQNPQEALDRTRARKEGGGGQRATPISQLFTAEDHERAAEVVRESLDAEIAIVVPGTKESPAYVEHVPDHKSRLEAVKFMAAYTEGLPVARQMVLHGDFKDLDADQRDVLLGSPSVLEVLGEMEEASVSQLENESQSFTDFEPLT